MFQVGRLGWSEDNGFILPESLSSSGTLGKRLSGRLFLYLPVEHGGGAHGGGHGGCCLWW